MTTKTSVYKNQSQKEYNLTEKERARYRKISQEAYLAKKAAQNGESVALHDVNKPTLDPNRLMPKLDAHNLCALSLFSGGGGLDLGFDRAGYSHIASYELIPICGETLKGNRPSWNVHSGIDDGDVKKVDWRKYKGIVDVIHGGPPCQPFSVAGQQQGANDERNMWGEFNKAVNLIKPRAFVAENVLGLLNPKFNDFVKKYILDELTNYSIIKFEINSADFGVPQIRRRVFFVGFKNKRDLKKFVVPKATHRWDHFVKKKITANQSLDETLNKTMGVRESLGLAKTQYDDLAPTLRSAFTGKRNTTSILNSAAGQEAWANLGIWPNGVQLDRIKASSFPAKNGNFRLSVKDCALIQGFPENWDFAGAVYQVLGQIGNSVSPPVAYAVAKNVAEVLLS